MYTHQHIHKECTVCTSIHTNIYSGVYMYVDTPTYTQGVYMYTNMYTRYMYIHGICIYIPTYTQCVYMFRHIYTMCTYIHSSKYTGVYMYTHSHIYSKYMFTH